MKKIRFLLFLAALVFIGCKNEDAAYQDPRGVDYAGAQSCVQCHSDVAHSSMVTAHFKATAEATADNVLGSFSHPKNVFDYGNGSKMQMEKRGDSLFQVWYKDGRKVSEHSFDIVFGGRNAQTSVYWHDFNTFELPLSYYRSSDSWGTSPGFSQTTPDFSRKMLKDCYACHSSNVRNVASDLTSEENNAFTGDVEDVIRKDKIIYGIDCERCHGPAKKHVDHHLEFPGEKVALHMTSFKSLSRQQKLDACSICHAGADGMKIKSRFDFKPGDNLTDYYRPIPNAEIDVHGNQHGMLTQSQCFAKSPNMDCTTCHDPHANAAKDPAHYARICSSCHAAPKHSRQTLASASVKEMEQNCVSCHMPKQASRAISFHKAYNSPLYDYRLSTHKIAVYPDKSTK
ncbi:hypothetical protein [Flavobacterium selenitireducens]|uniref:hypothetical protein n=1 Tax=Flavobacterium selenitireducens TaxID=2722704 RepID=UPI00168AAC40|nr:hypothetical protein [Flavobacterium selenitireducens]MBD3583399.1 hypothetical protein [Flavobacterium selenitireducens]